MKKALEEALNSVELCYRDLVDEVNNKLDPIFAEINNLIDTITEKGNSLSVDQIRDYLLKLQLEAFRLSEIKDKSQFRAEIAEAIEKDKYAVTFNSLEGSAASKDKLAQESISHEVLAEVVSNLEASLFKTKVDQIHRMVAVLTSILMSRMQETKFMNMGIADDTNSYKTKKQLLTEGNQF